MVKGTCLHKVISVRVHPYVEYIRGLMIRERKGPDERDFFKVYLGKGETGMEKAGHVSGQPGAMNKTSTGRAGAMVGLGKGTDGPVIRMGGSKKM